MRRTYLDHNAGAPLRPEAREAMLAALERGGNASSVHGEGRAARGVVEGARRTIVEVVGAAPNGVVFTSGGTEADNLAVYGAVASGVRRIFVSAVEHDAVRAPVAHEAATGRVETETLPVRRDGVFDLDALEDRLSDHDVERDGTFLLCLMLANNETGVIQPAAEAGDLARAHGGRVLVDACQAFGKIPVDAIELGADYLTLSSHKAGGPPGAGALIVKPDAPLSPTLRGGGQELYRRAGTENVPAIAGFGAVAALGVDAGEAATVRDRIEAGLVGVDGVKIWGRDAKRLPGTLCISAAGFSSETQVMACDLAGVAVSAGSACSSGKVRGSAVLAAMGAPDEDAGCALRISAGWSSEARDADAFLEAWTSAYDRVRARGFAAA